MADRQKRSPRSWGAGKKSSHPTGRGHIRQDGYHGITLWDAETQTSTYAMAHRLIWEEANGPIPEGYEIHHRNGDRQDNRLDNLMCVTRREHKRYENPEFWEKRGDVWWRRCVDCKEWLPATPENWYVMSDGRFASGRCKPCLCEHSQRLARVRRGVDPEQGRYSKRRSDMKYQRKEILHDES